MVIYVQATTGIDDMSGSKDWRIYPNPVDDLLHLEWNLNTADRIRIEVLDLAGKVLISEEKNSPGNNNHFIVRTSTLPPGLYILKCTSDGTMHMKKIMIQ